MVDWFEYFNKSIPWKDYYFAVGKAPDTLVEDSNIKLYLVVRGVAIGWSILDSK